MRRLIMKAKDSIWPKVTWEDSQLVVYYLGDEVDDVRIEETREFNFEELFISLEAGKSVFMPLKPGVAHTRAREEDVIEDGKTDVFGKTARA